jgi:1,5-anhydro-D-fructose reductase (1,5-anhydro-D-mannitol-forming)
MMPSPGRSDVKEQPAPLRWGLAGASDIAETRMLPALARCGHSVQALHSSSRAHAEKYAARNGIELVFDDLEALLASDAIDAVYISSLNDRHLEQARAAAAAGKHVLCEKPIAPSMAAGRAMIQACHDGGVVLAVNHHLPAAGTHRKIRELVRGGAIGRPLAVNVRHATLLPGRLRGWRLGDMPGAGVVMDLSCHDASVVNPLLGTAALQTSAITVRQGAWDAASEDASMAVVRYENEVLVHLHDSFTSPRTPTYLEVHGDAGSIHAHGVMTPEPDGTVVLSNRTGDREITVQDRRHTYDITLEAFSAAVAGTALAVSISILESARTGLRIPVDSIRAAGPGPDRLLTAAPGSRDGRDPG